MVAGAKLDGLEFTLDTASAFTMVGGGKHKGCCCRGYRDIKLAVCRRVACHSSTTMPCMSNQDILYNDRKNDAGTAEM